MWKWLVSVLDKVVPFNRGKPGVQMGVLFLLALLVCGFATRCHAADSYMQMGVGSTIIRGQTAAVDLAVVYPEAIGNDTAVEVGATFIGASQLNGDQRQNFALRAGVIDGFGRFDVGLGVAYLQNVDTYNGSNLNFSLMLAYRFKVPITVSLRHFSNGGTRSPNKGRDMLLVAWQFR